MEVTRETVLRKTHNGLRIYAHFLRKYYPGQNVLSLSGRECQPTRNPFNADKPTLVVKLVDECARHRDMEDAIPEGDAFDFASLSFKISGQALLDKLNDDLHLRIGQQGFYFNQELQPLLNRSDTIKAASPVFSYFTKPVTNVFASKQASLTDVFNLIKGDDFESSTITLRNISDPKEARKYKSQNFDYVTFSGTFSKRNDACLQRHSGLLTIDFDHIVDIPTLKSKLLNDEYFETELLFTSPSGDGVKWIIPTDLTKAKHQDYFKAVAQYIYHTYQIKVDQSGRDISRACFLPHDSEIFINPKYL